MQYYNRVSDWEAIARKDAAIESRLADRLALRSKFINQPVTTRQVTQDRRSLYELAENNEVLRKILRRMQK